MVDALEHADGIIGYNRIDSDKFNDNAYSLSDALDNTNTVNTHVWLKDPEGGYKSLKGEEIIVYLSELGWEWGVVYNKH